MRTLAIGDIHGCHTALTTLLDHVKPSPEDQIIFLGDYIDRGPASRQVIETLLGLGKSCSPVFLRGNHEVMILQARDEQPNDKLWRDYGGRETLSSYGVPNGPEWASFLPEAHWKFIEGTAKYFENDQHIFVHACLDPNLDMKDQPEYTLFWEYFMYLEPHKSGKCVVCGHSRQHSGKIKDNGFAVCIDTGPANRGWLICLDVNSRTFWQSNESGETREGSL